MRTTLAFAALCVAPALALHAPGEDPWAEANRELGYEVKYAAAQMPEDAELDLQERQLIGGNSDYKPYEMPCPTGVNWIRSASEGVGAQEKEYIAKRQPGINKAFADMMTKAGLQQPPRVPTVAITLSGGGYRAMINGLGMTQGMMSQSPESSAAGTGGLLDVATYMAGLSGGSWATGAFVANGGMLPTDILQKVLNLDSNLILPSDGKVSFYYNMLSNVRAKANAGYPTQITDYWALALGNHLLPAQWRLDTSPNITFSQLAKTVPALVNAEVPMPLIIAAEREPGDVFVPANATVWELTPWEYGSWAVGADSNKTTGFFTPIEYLGTRMNNGQPSGTCMKGFDQMSFVMGTSSTLFNAGILQIAQVDKDSAVVNALKDILQDVAQDKNDVAQYPNFAANYTGRPNPLANLDYLTMVDAGETNQNIPIEPLLMPSRNVDAILAFDNSADTTYSYPNGSSLWTTYNRALDFQKQFGFTIRMPQVPSTAGFVNGGLNQRPVFFGCNATDTPLIVYVPHYPWTWYSNSSTYQLQYDTPSALRQMENAMRSFTLNGTVPEWPKCLACAMSDRAFGYTAQNRSAECAKCFDTWCWDGVDAASEPAGEYEPVMGVTPTWLAQNGLSNNVQTAGVSQASVSAWIENAAAKPLLTSGATVAAALGAAVLGGVLTVLH